jgi:hypothetical protein
MPLYTSLRLAKNEKSNTIKWQPAIGVPRSHTQLVGTCTVTLKNTLAIVWYVKPMHGFTIAILLLDAVLVTFSSP